MQAIILVAGEGTRMRPLTLLRPKPLIPVLGRPLLEHVIDALPAEVDEIILVVGYKADMIQSHFGDSYKGRRIRYVHQWMPAGTAHALSMARPFLGDGTFLLMFGDDLHGGRAIAESLKYPLAVLAATHPEPSKFGVIELNTDGTLANIVEKPEAPLTNLISTGVMVLDARIFQYAVPRHESGEYYMTHPFSLLAKEHPVTVVQQDFWIPVGYPEDIARAEAALMQAR